MKVAVTGGTGFVGREVVAQLRTTGYDVHLVRRESKLTSPACDIAALSASLRGCEAVIHLVGIIAEVGNQTFENVHVVATRNIIAATRQAGIARYEHMSALGTRPDAMARYHQTKWAAEEIVRGSGLAWTIFRPSIIYGAGDGFVNLFARMSKYSPAMPLIGGGNMKFQPISVENVARCFVAALNEPQAINGTFDLGGTEVLTLREIIAAILTVTKRRRWMLPVPFSVATVQAALAELFFAKLLRKTPPLNRDQVTMLREDNVGDCQPADRLFSLRHEPFRNGIARYLA